MSKTNYRFGIDVGETFEACGVGHLVEVGVAVPRRAQAAVDQGRTDKVMAASGQQSHWRIHIDNRANGATQQVADRAEPTNPVRPAIEMYLQAPVLPVWVEDIARQTLRVPQRAQNEPVILIWCSEVSTLQQKASRRLVSDTRRLVPS